MGEGRSTNIQPLLDLSRIFSPAELTWILKCAAERDITFNQIVHDAVMNEIYK